MFDHDPEVLAAFAEESAERLDSLEAGLLELERTRTPSAALLNAVFRDAHSIKAAANLLHLKDLEAAAHRLEHVLERLRTGRLANGPDVCQALLDGLDLLRELVDASDTPGQPGQSSQPGQDPRLAALSAFSGS